MRNDSAKLDSSNIDTLSRNTESLNDWQSSPSNQTRTKRRKMARTEVNDESAKINTRNRAKTKSKPSCRAVGL
ncbi:4799_t:CDS:2 [Diversispora eburnea]|uniref:4799_t:CDS:1 n=1 Tax=Diversispora eburnea TaxID=1213867 RepID=A0A9N9G174_9GLOM|nr:4799_t:CDS:2 [Diversispora eburnea]